MTPSPPVSAVALLNDALGATGNTLVWNPKPATLPVDDPEVISSCAQRFGNQIPQAESGFQE